MVFLLSSLLKSTPRWDDVTRAILNSLVGVTRISGFNLFFFKEILLLFFLTQLDTRILSTKRPNTQVIRDTLGYAELDMPCFKRMRQIFSIT